MTPSISLIIPVLQDERVHRALASAISQRCHFDEIIIQNPNGLYADLGDASRNISVLQAPDQNLFDGLDIAIKHAKSEYIVMIGSDDYFIDDDFVTRAKDKLAKSGAPIYLERTAIVGKTIRLWPPIKFVSSGFVLPSHFGTAFKTSIAKSFLLDSYTDSDILANDSIWLYDFIRKMEGKAIGTNVVSFCMSAGGVSTSDSFAPFRNYQSLVRKASKRGYGRGTTILRHFVALLCKATYRKASISSSLRDQIGGQ